MSPFLLVPVLVVLVVLLPPTHSLCPPSTCRFTLCNPSPYSLSLPHDTPSPSHPICLNATPISVANTLPALLLPSLTQITPPSLFKTLTLPNSTAALAHQTTAPRPDLNARCVLLPFSSVQLIQPGGGVLNLQPSDAQVDCVQFEVAASTTEPSPTTMPPSTPPATPQPATVTPSAPTPSSSPLASPTVPDTSPDEVPTPSAFPSSLPESPSISPSAASATSGPPSAPSGPPSISFAVSSTPSEPPVTPSAAPSTSALVASSPSTSPSPSVSLITSSDPTATATARPTESGTMSPSPSFSDSSDGPPVASPAPLPTPSAALLFSPDSNGLEVIECDTESVLLFLRNDSITVTRSDIIWSIPLESPEVDVCQPCAYLARKVTAVEEVSQLQCSSGAGRCVRLSTVDAEFGEVYSMETLQQLNLGRRSADSLQEIFTCPSLSSTSRVDVPHVSERQVSRIPTTCAGMQSLNPDGSCPFTRCTRMMDSGADCYGCGNDCNNGCGSEDFNVPDNIPGVFNFSESCCIHDHCYATSFTKEQCDLAFLRDNLLSCARISSFLSLILPLGLTRLCITTSVVYYLGVRFGGTSAYNDAQFNQTQFELSPSCAAQPPLAASIFTDPHLRTFDGLSYDCQASGEFTLLLASEPDVEIQARFRGPNTAGSVTTGLALSEGSFPVIQASVPVSAETDSVEIGGCPVAFYIGGDLVNPVEAGFADRSTSIIIGSGTVTLTLPSGVRVSFSPRRSSSFGCYLEFMTTSIPSTLTTSTSFGGLLGSPNRNASDDWTTRSGRVLQLPGDLIFEPAYNYCTRNWCVRNAGMSKFTYEPGTSFATFFECDEPYGTAPDLSDASPQLRQLCGAETACLIDGIVGGFEDAERALGALREADAAFNQFSPLGFMPADLVVNVATNVLVTVNVNVIPGNTPNALERFLLFRVDPVTGEQEAMPILVLEDNGQAAFSDAQEGDGIFSNLLAISTTVGGERFGFRAVPVINGEERADSAFATTALTGLRSFAAQSDGDIPSEEGGTIEVGLSRFRSLAIAVKYSWTADQIDLDTGTQFLEGIVGFACSPGSVYMDISDDDTGTAGSETATIDVIRARDDGLWENSTRIDMRAGWFAARSGEGPATVRVFLLNRESRREIEGPGLSLAIQPGTQFDCAATDVGFVRVVVDGGNVRISVAGASA